MNSGHPALIGVSISASGKVAKCASGKGCVGIRQTERLFRPSGLCPPTSNPSASFPRETTLPCPRLYCFSFHRALNPVYVGFPVKSCFLICEYGVLFLYGS